LLAKVAKLLTTRQAAKKLGLDVSTLSRYISLGKITAPATLEVGALKVHAWTEEEIDRARALLPKIKNGRKTRYQKQKNKPQAKKPVPHKKKN